MPPTAFVTQAMQAILAPAVMVAASALFLLGLNARYVAVITRIRLLNEERRVFASRLQQQLDLSSDDRDRLRRIEHQLKILRRITWHLRNSIRCQVVAASLFVLTSCAIGLHYLTAVALVEEVAIA